MPDLNLQDFFFSDSIETAYEVVITREAASFLAKKSASTAKKLMAAPCISYDKAAEQATLKITKENGISVQEAIQNQATQNIDAVTAYNSLVADLLKEQVCTSEEKVTELVFDPTQHVTIPEEYRKKAKFVYDQAILMQDKSLAELTAFINGRVSSAWTISDTTSLPTSLYDQFALILSAEKNNGEIDEAELTEKKITIITND